MDSATKSEPPDCGIASVSSREYVCLQYQLTKQSNLIEIERKCKKKWIWGRLSYFRHVQCGPSVIVHGSSARRTLAALLCFWSLKTCMPNVTIGIPQAWANGDLSLYIYMPISPQGLVHWGKLFLDFDSVCLLISLHPRLKCKPTVSVC